MFWYVVELRIFQMDRVALCVFVLLIHVMLLHSAEEPRCPPDSCNDVVGATYFPFRSTKQPPECGMYTLDCSDSARPRIQLKEGGYWHQLDNYPLIRRIGINDTDLEDELRLLKIGSCNDDFFEKLSLPIASPTLDVFVATDNLTLFKCSSTGDKASFPDLKYVCNNVNHTYYHIPSGDGLPSPPPQCSIIQLPTNQKEPPYNLSALITTFFLRVEIPACYDCPRKEGECLVDEGKFICFGAKGGGNSAWKLRLGFAIGGAAILSVISFILWNYKQKCSRKKPIESRQIVEAFLRSYGPLQVRRYSYSEVKRMTNSFKEKLGQGGYGSVYKGKFTDGSLVAVKVLSKLKGNNGEEFMNEVAAISRTSHVNVVTLLGFCFDGSERALIYEFMPNGSLEKFIFDAKTPQQDHHHLGWEALDRISLGIARGLEYLHRGCNTRILHFDIKPHNILLDENFTPKIADFGLAKICNMKESIVSMLCARGTAGYIAPEVFCRTFGGVSHKSDVYSYGMMLSEMVGGRRNIDVGVEDTSEIFFPHWIYKRLELDEELGLQSIVNDEDNVRARKMIIVSLWCIQTDPSNRPSMKKVIDMLEGSVDALQIPPKPYLSSPPKSPADSSTTLVSIQ